jgi:hypothetical protein
MFTASGMVVTVGEVDAALDALLIAGKVEAMNSARLGRRWRVLRNRPGVDLSAPPAP